tara:strand:+ start:2283 stop:2828 length:546 start_codon:yes stop_codon:yes gene_type:complete
MKGFLHFSEALDTVHPHELVANEVEEHQMIRDENDRPVGVYGRTLRHKFRDPHSGDTIHVTHEIDHTIDEYDPKNVKATRITASFNRSPGEGSTEQTYGRVEGGKGTLGIFSTVGHITQKVAGKHGKGDTTVDMEAENPRVPSYVRMGTRLSGGNTPTVKRYPDNHPGAGNSNISFKIPKT